MLIYLGTGERRYGVKPVHPDRRRGWEFQAVLRGKIGLINHHGPESLKTKRLWIFPPKHLHGWIGDKDKKAEVVVFHFLAVPEILRRLFEKEAILEIELSSKDIQRIRELSVKVARYWNHPTPGIMLSYEHALTELSLMACESTAYRTSKLQESFAKKRVDAAILWYAERIEESPELPEIARATGISTAHLRRLFHEVLQTSPKNIMDQIRFQRALQLMSDANIKLETISEKCGFGSASAFSRAFKIKFGCPPESWRHSELS